MPLVIAMLGVRWPKWCMGMDQFRKCCLAKFVQPCSFICSLMLCCVVVSLCRVRVCIEFSNVFLWSVRKPVCWLSGLLSRLRIMTRVLACFPLFVCFVYLVGWFVGWLVGWFVGWLVDRCHFFSHQKLTTRTKVNHYRTAVCCRCFGQAAPLYPLTWHIGQSSDVKSFLGSKKGVGVITCKTQGTEARF